MAFTHDLDINGVAQGLGPANSAKQESRRRNQNETSGQAFGVDDNRGGGGANAAIFGTYAQPADSPWPAARNFTAAFEDPLLELVMRDKQGRCEPEKLNELAARAANLPQTEEISARQTTSVKNIAGIFTGTENFAKRVEDTTKKRRSILESTDSEGCGEVPLLGRISRARRAKSANIRGSAKGKRSGRDSSKSSDRQQLFGEESSSSDNFNAAGAEEVPGRESLDYAEVRMGQAKETTLAVERRPSRSDGVRPLNIDVAMGNEQL